MKKINWVYLLTVGFVLINSISIASPKDDMIKYFHKKWINKNFIATKSKIVGKTMKIQVSFQHRSTQAVLNDPELEEQAKQMGIKKIEFYDWSGLTKDVIYKNLK